MNCIYNEYVKYRVSMMVNKKSGNIILIENDMHVSSIVFYLYNNNNQYHLIF